MSRSVYRRKVSTKCHETVKRASLPAHRLPRVADFDAHTLHFRSVFISDVHLGSRGCQANLLLRFLSAVRTDTLYLVGDIVDLERLQRSVFWPQEHNDVLRAILGKAKHGTRVVYIPGNHDRQFRDFCGLSFGNLHIRRRHVHEAADGKRYLVLHGDEFDGIVRCNRIIRLCGDATHRVIVRLNDVCNRIRAACGYPYWSLAAAMKRRSRIANDFVERYQQAAMDCARRYRVDGIVCGHVHHPNRISHEGSVYLNDGDWVEHCTALIEHRDGRMALVDWPRLMDQLTTADVTPVAAREAA